MINHFLLVWMYVWIKVYKIQFKLNLVSKLILQEKSKFYFYKKEFSYKILMCKHTLWRVIKHVTKIDFTF